MNREVHVRFCENAWGETPLHDSTILKEKSMKHILTIILLFLINLIASAQNDSIPFKLTRQYFKGELRNYKS